MNGRIAAIALIAVLGMTILAPALSDDASAMTESEGRLSIVYISSAETVVPKNLEINNNTFCMLPGSDNQLAMEAYISDPQNSAPVTGDDRDLILGSEPGTPIVVYVKSSYRFVETTDIGSGLVTLTPRLAPYSIDVDAETGDIVKIKIVEAGGNSSGYINVIYFKKEGPNPSTVAYSVGGIYTTEMKEGDSLSMTLVWMDDDDIYVDIRYNIDVSAPNGSATSFAAVCIAITALTLVLMIAAALKPKWAK